MPGGVSASFGTYTTDSAMLKTNAVDKVPGCVPKRGPSRTQTMDGVKEAQRISDVEAVTPGLVIAIM
jgi:hypothetical protein